jgi:phage major head subunit gpT-like protein
MISPSVFEKLANGWFQDQLRVLNGQAGAPTDLMRLAMPTDSTGKYTSYGWLDDLPTVKELLGPKKARELADHAYQLLNREWYDAVNVKYADLRDDQVGAYESRIRELPTRMQQFWRKLISDLVRLGTSGLAFDQLPYFSNAQLSRVNDNLLTGNGTDTVAHFMTDLDTVIQAMAEFTDTEGEELNIKPDVIVCAPAARRIITTAVGSPSDASGSNASAINPFRDFNFTVIADPKLAADPNDWYAFSTQGILKPFIFQQREAMQSMLDDTQRKRARSYQYSVEWDGVAGYGLPHLGVKVVNS